VPIDLAKETSIKVACFDKDILTDEEVGSFTFSINELLETKARGGGLLKLFHKGKVAAQIAYSAKLLTKSEAGLGPEKPLSAQKLGDSIMKKGLSIMNDKLSTTPSNKNYIPSGGHSLS
jgi:hypothetical protein